MVGARLAIDLSGTKVRVLAGIPGGPMKAAEAAIPSGSVNGGNGQDGNALAPVIRQLVGRLDYKDNKAMIVASDSLASFRVLSFAKDVTEPKIDSVVRAQLPVDGNRMGIQRHDVPVVGPERTIFAVAFDRLRVQGLASAVRLAGLEPTVVELKSICVARVVPVTSCVVLDLSVEPAELFLVDRSLPRLWHTFKVDLDNPAEMANQMGTGLAAVLSFYKRLAGGAEYPADAPVFVAAQGSLLPNSTAEIQTRIGHPLYSLPAPSRVAPDISHATYLACLGLLMRRR